MRGLRTRSRAKLALFLKTVPYLKEIGNKTVFKLSERYGVTPIKLERLILKARKKVSHGN
jgi:hypothetical protein